MDREQMKRGAANAKMKHEDEWMIEIFQSHIRLEKLQLEIIELVGE